MGNVIKKLGEYALDDLRGMSDDDYIRALNYTIRVLDDCLDLVSDSISEYRKGIVFGAKSDFRLSAQESFTPYLSIHNLRLFDYRLEELKLMASGHFRWERLAEAQKSAESCLQWIEAVREEIKQKLAIKPIPPIQGPGIDLEDMHLGLEAGW